MSWLEDTLAAIAASGEGAVNLGAPMTEREREMQAPVKGGGYGSPDMTNPAIRLALGDGPAPVPNGRMPFSIGGDPMTAGGMMPNGPGLPVTDPMIAGGLMPNGPGGDMASAQIANRLRAANPAFSFPTSQPMEKYTDYASGYPIEATRPKAQFPDIPVGPVVPPQMAAQSAISGLNSPMGGGGAPFSIAGAPPSLVAAKEMTAPPPMTQQAAVPGIVAPGAAPGVPSAPAGPPAVAPPVVAKGGADDEDTPAGAPTDTSARRRDVAGAPMGAAPQMPPPEPSFGERMQAGGKGIAAALREASPTLIALGQGLSGGGWGTAAELAAARNKRDEGLALQAQQGNATARLLASKGASPEEIRAAVAGGPDVVKALVAQYFGKDKFAVTQTGEVEDQYGGKRKVFKIFNSNDGTFKDVPADSAAEAKNIASGEAPELNESQKNRVQAIIDGREPYPATSRAPDAARIRAGVHAADPNFDAVNYKSREQTRIKFTKGKGADNLTAFNTAIGHLGSLDKSIDELNNSGFPAWNKYIANPVAEQFDSKYQKGLKDFQTARTAVADELTRAFRGSGGNVHDIIQWEKAINAADSPIALKAAVRAAAELLGSRITAVGDEYNRGMGTTKDPLELLNPRAAEAFKRLQENDRPTRQDAKAAPKPGNYVYRNGALVPE